MSAPRRGGQESALACRSFRAAMKELRGLRTRASVRQRKGSGPVNPSLLAATKELRACEPEPPCGNEKASGFCRTGSLVQGISVGFWLLFREVGAGREGFESLRRLPPVVMLPRAGARSGCGPRSVWGPPGVPPGVAPGFTPGCRAAAGPAPRRRRRCGWLPPARAPRASRSRRAPRWTRYPWRRPPRCRSGGRPPSPPVRGR